MSLTKEVLALESPADYILLHLLETRLSAQDDGAYIGHLLQCSPFYSALTNDVEDQVVVTDYDVSNCFPHIFLGQTAWENWFFLSSDSISKDNAHTALKCAMGYGAATSPSQLIEKLQTNKNKKIEEDFRYAIDAITLRTQLYLEPSSVEANQFLKIAEKIALNDASYACNYLCELLPHLYHSQGFAACLFAIEYIPFIISNTFSSSEEVWKLWNVLALSAWRLGEIQSSELYLQRAESSLSCLPQSVGDKEFKQLVVSSNKARLLLDTERVDEAYNLILGVIDFLISRKPMSGFVIQNIWYHASRAIRIARKANKLYETIEFFREQIPSSALEVRIDEITDVTKDLYFTLKEFMKFSLTYGDALFDIGNKQEACYIYRKALSVIEQNNLSFSYYQDNFNLSLQIAEK